MPVIMPLLYFVWKLAKRTRVVKREDVDLVWEAPMITAYEEASSPPIGFLRDFWDIFTKRGGKAKSESTA
ncbi:hypothetical protein ACHAPJ_011394 [Fusarium lateritium]